jgi:hypothetical protein
MSVNAFVNGLDLYKSDESLKIWRVETPDRKGEFLFTFDCRKGFKFFHDYPEKLTDEEIAIFEKEYPELAALKQPRKAR